MASECVMTWGTAGKINCLGHDEVDQEGVCALPHPVERTWNSTARVSAVEAGESCSGVVLDDGTLWLWGSGRGGRLGNGTEENAHAPTMQRSLAREWFVISLSIGQSHLGCVCVPRALLLESAVNTRDSAQLLASEHGVAFLWGINGFGCLSRATTMRRSLVPVTARAIDGELRGVTHVACGYQATLLLVGDGALYACGSRSNGVLGLGKPVSGAVPHATLVTGVPVFKDVYIGSLQAAAITHDGELYTWGYGKHGNLGLGSRVGFARPRRVEYFVERGITIRSAALAQGMLIPASPYGESDAPREDALIQGREGPHMLIVAEDGRVFSCGSCHKGMLGNLRQKMLQGPYDELLPYHIGSPCADDEGGDSDSGEHTRTGGEYSGCSSSSHPASEYLRDLRITAAAAGAIHSMVLADNGQLYAFGCGSGGRLGIRRFLEGLHGRRSRMKCYVSQPTVLDAFSGGVGILRFEQLSTSRRHMIALARVIE